MAVDLRRHLNVAAAARMLACSPNSVRNWVKMGLLPAVRRGRRVLIHPDDLAGFVTCAAGGTTPTPGGTPASEELRSLGVG